MKLSIFRRLDCPDVGCKRRPSWSCTAAITTWCKGSKDKKWEIALWVPNLWGYKRAFWFSASCSQGHRTTSNRTEESWQSSRIDRDGLLLSNTCWWLQPFCKLFTQATQSRKGCRYDPRQRWVGVIRAQIDSDIRLEPLLTWPDACFHWRPGAYDYGPSLWCHKWYHPVPLSSTPTQQWTMGTCQYVVFMCPICALLLQSWIALLTFGRGNK